MGLGTTRKRSRTSSISPIARSMTSREGPKHPPEGIDGPYRCCQEEDTPPGAPDRNEKPLIIRSR